MSYKNSYEDGIYSSDMTKLGDSVLQSIQETIQKNGGVGTITGYFDADLSILSIGDLLLHNLGYSYESLMAQTKGSLKKLFYGEMSLSLRKTAFVRFMVREKGRSSQRTVPPSMCASTKKIQRMPPESRSGSCPCRSTGRMRISLWSMNPYARRSGILTAMKTVRSLMCIGAMRFGASLGIVIVWISRASWLHGRSFCIRRIRNVS